MIRGRLLTPVLIVFWLFGAVFAGLGQQATAPAPIGKLVEIKVPAPSLKNNLLGEPNELTVSVYLPPSYAAAPMRRYPTLYLLHGFLGNDKSWTLNGYQGMNLASVMDGHIREGKLRELIVVIPNSRSNYGGAFYINSKVTGNWEDYIYRDLVQYVDEKYRTIPTAESRGIAGHSMGGYGALVLGMKHPEVFSVVYALSPCCTALEGDMSATNPVWQKVLRLTSKEQLKLRPQAFDEFYTIALVALAAAFSPNPERAPFYVDFPFKEAQVEASTVGLEKNQAAYESWRARMPLYMIDEHQKNLKKLRGIFIDYGEKEQFSHIVIGGREISKSLAERSIPHVFEVYAGGDHSNKIRERFERRLLPFFSERLAPASP